MVTAWPVSASMLTTRMLSGRRPSRSGPASPPSSSTLYRPSIGGSLGPATNTDERNPLAVVARYAPYAAVPDTIAITTTVNTATHARAEGAVFTSRTSRSVSNVSTTQSTA